ncbi:Holliday junction resolvase RuvX [Feifania hominis]|uniref:Putative pre-16S rRNA nuclease n=1 Tax=Feifania hominis TaxID=2763660 RepID=A0A926HR30_9FIRM|nr:Holliday junction resolvase RuvX [Feifania hominis]MBC8536987.1 Holliday junction resolvase RuvX [Feifania hominis]
MSRVMGVDFGDVRTGIALSDPSGFLASTLCTITETDMKKVAAQVAALAAQHAVSAIVIGYPKNMNNTLGPRVEKTLAFRDELAGLTGCELVLRDERCTTISATRQLNDTNTRGKKRKAVLDAVAATIILQDYLDSMAR